MRIDLHAHSSASDGTDTPTELICAAAAAGLDVVAITDHDTTAGWDEALASRPAGLTVIPGAEISCVHHPTPGQRVSLHLLAYLFDPADGALNARLRRLQAARVTRAVRMVANLVEAGYPISWGQVCGLAAGGSVGRPHIGRALVASGAVPDLATAFGGVLSSRGGFFVPKDDVPVLEAIRLVRAAGGLPVFAHPLAHRRGPVVDDDVIAAMADAGLVGLEVDHPDHDVDSRAHAAGLAVELGLVGTGSSDYHGGNKQVRLAECTTSAAAFEQLMALPTARRPAAG